MNIRSGVYNKKLSGETNCNKKKHSLSYSISSCSTAARRSLYFTMAGEAIPLNGIIAETLGNFVFGAGRMDWLVLHFLSHKLKTEGEMECSSTILNSI